MSEVNGYELSREWFNYSFENPEKIRPVHTAIYFFAIDHCNRLGWKKKFGFPATMVMEAVGIRSYNTYKKALDDLVGWGFIQMVEKARNQYSSNKIALSKNNNASGKALDKALIKHASKQSESIDSIYKQGNKGTKEQENHQFDAFWNLYDKKRERKKCEKKWGGLSQKDKDLILEFIPIYKKSQPDEQYRKNPHPFLISEIWKDDWDEYKEKQDSENTIPKHMELSQWL